MKYKLTYEDIEKICIRLKTSYMIYDNPVLTVKEMIPVTLETYDRIEDYQFQIVYIRLIFQYTKYTNGVYEKISRKILLRFKIDDTPNNDNVLYRKITNLFVTTFEKEARRAAKRK